jgi:hypothetical protein
MGRCYEFGVAVVDGCEHVMTVGPQGGHCGCSQCGARCEGRFRACAAILATPGYVPVASPPSPRPASQTPASAVVSSSPAPARKARFSLFGGPPEEEAGANDHAVAEFRSMLANLLDRHERALAAIESIDATVGARDVELIAAFNRLTQAYAELTAEVQAGHEELSELATMVVRLAARLEREPLPRALHG